MAYAHIYVIPDTGEAEGGDWPAYGNGGDGEAYGDGGSGDWPRPAMAAGIKYVAWACVTELVS